MSYIATSGGNKVLAQSLPADRYRSAKPKIPQVGLHTTEFPAGRSLLSLWQFIDTRTTYGSYNAGSDAHGTSNQYAPWSWYTWHAPAINPWAAGISANCRADEWDKISKEWRDNLVNGLALQAHRYSRWCVEQGLGPVPARMITSDQAKRGVYGFVYHGDLQADRTDPGGPRNVFPRDEFLAEFERLENPKPVVTPASSGKPSEPKPKSKPWSAGTGPWPKAYLTVTGQRNQYQDKALFKLLGDAGYDGATLAIRLQKRLRADGEYHGAITANSRIGPQTIQAWQRFLKKRGYYKGAVTPRSQWGPSTTRATVAFLNQQAELY